MTVLGATKRVGMTLLTAVVFVVLGIVLDTFVVGHVLIPLWLNTDYVSSHFPYSLGIPKLTVSVFAGLLLGMLFRPWLVKTVFLVVGLAGVSLLLGVVALSSSSPTVWTMWLTDGLSAGLCLGSGWLGHLLITHICDRRLEPDSKNT